MFFLVRNNRGRFVGVGISWLMTFGHDGGGGGAIGPRSLSLGFSDVSQQDVIGIDSNMLTDNGRI